MNNQRGIVALPVAGFLYLIGGLVRGAYVLPSSEAAQSFAQWSTRTACTAGYFILIAAAITSVFGYSALAAQLRGRIATAANVLSIVGIQFLIALFGCTVTLLPAIGHAYLNGNTHAVDIATQVLSGGTLSAIGALISLNIFGHILFAIGIWRSQSIPRWVAIPFVLAPIGMCMPFIYPIELLGFVLYLLSSSIIAKSVLQSTASACAVQSHNQALCLSAIKN